MRNRFALRISAHSALAGMLLAGAVFAGGAVAQEVEIFQNGPPAPEAMADMLWPEAPLTRSLRPAEPPKPQSFGLLIQFEFNSTSIKPASRAYLDAVGEMMALDKTKGKKLVVEGHADASGPASYNQTLSERRARAVTEYLKSKHDIQPSQLAFRGKGESQPLKNTNPTAPINRRVQFHPGN